LPNRFLNQSGENGCWKYLKIMSRKKIILLGMFIGSFAGGYAPSFFGVDDLMISIFCSTAGGILGIWIGYRLS